MDDWRKYMELALQFDPRDFLAFAQRMPSQTNFGPMPDSDVLRLQAKNPYEAEQLMRQYDEMGIPVRASAPVPQGWDTSKLPVPQGAPGIDPMLFNIAQQQARAQQAAEPVQQAAAPPEPSYVPGPMNPNAPTAGEEYVKSLMMAGLPIGSETSMMAGNPILPGDQPGAPTPTFSPEAMKQLAGMMPQAPEVHYAPYAPSGPGPSQVRMSPAALEAVLAMQRENRNKPDLVPTIAALLAGRM